MILFIEVTMIIKIVFISYTMAVISLEVKIMAYVYCDSDYFWWLCLLGVVGYLEARLFS